MQVLIDMLSKKVVGLNQNNKIMTYIINFPDGLNPTKEIVQNFKRQKIDSNGNFVYLKEVISYDLNNHEQISFVEVTTPFETIDGKLVYHQPSLEDVTQTVTLDLLSNPSAFNLDDIIQAKGTSLLTNSGYKYIILDEEIDESDFDFSLNHDTAITGVKTFKILPNCAISTLPINLPESTNSVSIYLEADVDISVRVGIASNSATPIVTYYELTNNEISFNESVSSIYLKFINNNSTDIKQVNAYGILC